jgi:hypothetical protein
MRKVATQNERSNQDGRWSAKATGRSHLKIEEEPGNIILPEFVA